MTRADIAPGQQVVQSCHAVREFDRLHRGYEGVANLVCLSVADEDALLDVARRLGEAGVRYAIFREPDIGDQVTALAAEPGRKSKRVLQRLTLALCEHAA